MEALAQCVVTAALSLTLSLHLHPIAAQDCPTAQVGRQGLVVERGDRTKTEVFYDPPIVRTVMRFGGSTLLETTLFEGLFQLERIDRGQRTTFRPKEELATLFPIKVGQRASVQFLTDVRGQATGSTVALSVVDQDSLYLGACKYDVLKIERHEARNGGPLRFVNTDYYAPALKVVIGKEYKERDGRTNLIKFDRIYPIRH